MQNFLVEVAVPSPLFKTFHYKHSEVIDSGVRVRVPFGRQELLGVVLSCSSADQVGQTSYKLKDISEVIDRKPVYSRPMLKLGRWLAEYYLHPIGEVLRAMLPAGDQKKQSCRWWLTEQGLAARKDSSHPLSGVFAGIFSQKSSLLAETVARKWKSGLCELTDLSLAELKSSEYIKVVTGKTRSAKTFSHCLANAREAVNAVSCERPGELTPQQAEAVAVIQKALESKEAAPKKTFLLHGVTGSGKTEVYLEAIEHLLSLSRQGAELRPQALVLVPEIALTPQMTGVFEKRFGKLVVVVHSGLTHAERWERLEKIHSGDASILIGPRSAVFAPFAALRLLIVDEEHDSSYKQQSSFCYNGRDVAVVRAQLEGACVVLGSATPSLESFYNAKIGKYRLLELPKRVLGLPLPSVQLVKVNKARCGLFLPAEYLSAPSQEKFAEIMQSSKQKSISSEVLEQIKENFEKGKQSIILIPRRGYSYYLIDLESREPLRCKQCSISLTFHKQTSQLCCHYCGYEGSLSKVSQDLRSKRIVAVGHGSQRAEDFLRTQIPEAKIVRLDSDSTNKKGFLESALEDFRQQKTDILVGTQMLAKGHDFPNVALTVILDVEQILNLPDFRTNERAFQLMVQAAGRCGRAQDSGKVLVQAVDTENPVVISSLKHDYHGFAARELAFREAMSYPPFSRSSVLEMSSPVKKTLWGFAGKVESWIDRKFEADKNLAYQVRVLGPAVPEIEMIRGRFRQLVLVFTKDSVLSRTFLRELLAAFDKRPQNIRLHVDIDPQAIL